MYRSVNAVTSSGVFNYVFTLPSPPQPRSTLFPYTTLFRSRGLPGFVKVVSRGNYVAVVFEREEQAIAGARDRLFFTLEDDGDRKSTRLNSSHTVISYAVFCLKKKKRIVKYGRSLYYAANIL